MGCSSAFSAGPSAGTAGAAPKPMVVSPPSPPASGQLREPVSCPGLALLALSRAE